MQTDLVQAQPVRLLTFNTWKCDGAYRLRLQARVNQLTPLDADVIALQEVFVTADGEMHTGRHLAKALGMTLVEAASREKRRYVEGEWRASHAGLAILTRWPILKSKIFQLPSDDADGERVALLCELDLNGHRLCVITTHLTHLTDAQALRECQWQTVLDKAGHVASRASVVVCGDLNAALSSHELHRPMTAGGWHEVSGPSGFSNKVTHRNADGAPSDLDHVVAQHDERLQWASAAVVLDRIDPETGVVPSDHAAVLVNGWLAFRHKSFVQTSNSCHTQS